MKKSKIVAAMLALSMLAGALASCNVDDSTEETTKTATETATENVIEEKTESENVSETEKRDEDSQNESVNIADSETENAKETETEETVITDLGVDYSSTILLAEKLSGAVNGYFSNARNMATISNGNVVIEYPLTQTMVGDGAVRSLGGGEYLSAVSDVFVKNTSGDVFYLSGAKSKERMNIYRLGSYYYEFHMLDGIFANYSIIDEYRLDLRTYTSGANGVDNLKYNKKEEVLSFDIKDKSDPYVCGAGFKISTEDYNAVEITISTTDSSSCRLYIHAGHYGGYNGEQNVAFTTIPDGEFHTYIVPIFQLPDYTGDVKGVRIDIGTKVGEQIRVSSLKLVKTAATAPEVKLDRTYHMYSDKVNAVTRLVAGDTVDDLASFGTVTEISADKVDKLVVKDKNGTHNSIDGVDWASAEYIGFDINGVGVYGHILLPDATSGKLSVTLKEGEYEIVQEYTLPEGTVIEPLDSVLSGFRMYTDENHDFDEFLKRAEEERHPLEGISVKKNTYGAKYTGYDPIRGAYTFNVKGTGFQAAYDAPYTRFVVSACFTGLDKDREIYVLTHTDSGNLESGALMSSDGLMLPVDLEVCKNFRGENEEPFFDNGDASYGEIIFPYVVEAEKENQIHVINLYQNWGNFPLKQISSIQFIAPYYHLSVGTTETNCIAPYYVYGKDHWTLPDFRAMSAPLWTNQPQHTSIGRLYFLEYTTSDGVSYASESIDNKITAYGPTYCDIDMNYLSDDGKIKAYYRHMEMPHTDENRTYYELVLEVLDDISIKDFKNDFAFFSFDGRFYLFDKLGYVNENNECVVTDANMTGTPNYITLGDKSPYVSYFDGPETDDKFDYVNFALVVKNYSFNIGGKDYEGNLVLRDVRKGDLNRMSLTLDLGEVTLKKGDKFTINMILLPWGDPYAENDENVRNVRQDSCLAPYKLDVAVGSVIEDVYLPRVMSDNGTAEFTLSGGANNCVVRVYGFDKLTVPTVLEKICGEWREYKLNSDDCAYDGYTVYYDGDGKYSYAFVVNMDDADSRTFKVTASKNFTPLEDGWWGETLNGIDFSELPLNVYITPENEEVLKANMYAYGCKKESSEDLSYFRFTGINSAPEGYVFALKSNAIYEVTGQYVVFKYRAPTDSEVTMKDFELFIGNVRSGPKGDESDRIDIKNSYIPDGEWHVVVVDASTLSGYVIDTSGQYRANFMRVDVLNSAKNQTVTENCYIDIAYFGISDNLEDIYKLNADMDEILLYQDGNTVRINTETGKKIN